MKKIFVFIIITACILILNKSASATERHPFLEDLSQAYKSANLNFTPAIKKYIFNKLSKPTDPFEQSGLGSELPPARNRQEELILYKSMEVLISQFFKKIKTGESYFPVHKIKLNFGESPKERIGISSGGYYRLFVAYWTMKAKLKEYQEKNFTSYGYANVYYLDSIVTFIEYTVGEAFFPTPGPINIPLSQRRKGIEEMLQAFAPDMPISELYDGADTRIVGWPVLE